MYADSRRTLTIASLVALRGVWLAPVTNTAAGQSSLCMVGRTPTTSIRKSPGTSRRPDGILARPWPFDSTKRGSTMKVRNSLKSWKQKDGSKVVRRRGRTIIVNKLHPRWKARQG